MIKKAVFGIMLALALIGIAFLEILVKPSLGDIPTIEIPLFELLQKEVTKFEGGVNISMTFRNHGFNAASGTVWIPWENVYYAVRLSGESRSRNITETSLQFDINGDGDTSDVFTIYCVDNKTVEIDGVTAHSMFIPEQRIYFPSATDARLIYDVLEKKSFTLGSKNYTLYRVVLPENPWDIGYAGFGVESFFRYHPSPNIEFVIEQKGASINSTSTAEIVSLELNGTLTPCEFDWISSWFYDGDEQWYVNNAYVYPLGFLASGSTFTVHLSIRGDPSSYSLFTILNWAPDTLHRYRYLVNLSEEYFNEIPFTIWTSERVGVKTGDWIKYDYTTVGAPPGTPLPQWLKMEFVSVEGATANVRVTMHMSDGTEQNQTMVLDIASGGGTSTAFSGFVIPTNLTTGDSIYMSGYGDVMIAGETTGIYAGATKKVVYASFSQAGTQLTYYWDKQTGVLVGASAISGNITATFRATETNMWQAQPALAVYPFEITVSADEVFTVNVTVVGVADLYAWQAKLSFDNSVLNCTGAWYPEDHVFDGKEFVSVEPVIDNTEGYVLHGCCLLGEEETFNGDGTLFQIEFKAFSGGKTLLELSEIIPGGGDTFLLDHNGQDILIGKFDGYVMVEGGMYCDLDNDGKVDIQDLAVAARAFGSYLGHPRWNPIADINRDDKVNIIDLVLIAKNFGKTYP